MSKIYIKSRREPMLVENAQALKIKKDWLMNPNSRDIVEIGSEVFKMSDIKSISGVSENDNTELKFSLDIPDDRKLVREFEASYVDWRKGAGAKYKVIPSLMRYFEFKGAVRMVGDRQCDVTIIDSVLYHRLSRLWSAYGNLKLRRETAKKLERESNYGN